MRAKESQRAMAVLCGNIRYSAIKSGFLRITFVNRLMKPAPILAALILSAPGPLAPCAIAQEIVEQGTAAQEESVALPPPDPWPPALRDTPDMREGALASDTAMAIADTLSPQLERALDAAVAANIAFTGQYTGFSVESWIGGASSGRAIVVNGYSRSKGDMFPDPGVKVQDLGTYRIGDPRLLAVGVEQRFADSRNMATNIKLRHMSGPVDLQVDVRGNKSLANPNPMHFTYNSSAFYKVNSALALGMVARGDLGTLDDFAPLARHDAGAVARLKLLGKDKSLSAETGYDMRLGPGSANQPGRSYVNLNFNWKL